MRIYTASATAENVVALFGNFEPDTGGSSCSGTDPLVVEDLHAAGGCGPVLIENADTSTATNCDRSYTLGAGFEQFFSDYGSNFWLIQDAHDPNDHAWDNNDFASLTIPTGYVADIYLMVPVGSSAGHSHSADEYPNIIDPRGGWTDLEKEYTEDNGIPRRVWFKSVQGTFALYHSITMGWGYLYMVTMRCSAGAATPRRATLWACLETRTHHANRHAPSPVRHAAAGGRGCNTHRQDATGCGPFSRSSRAITRERSPGAWGGPG